jgi:hypothetical protein
VANHINMYGKLHIYNDLKVKQVFFLRSYKTIPAF